MLQTSPTPSLDKKKTVYNSGVNNNNAIFKLVTLPYSTFVPFKHKNRRNALTRIDR